MDNQLKKYPTGIKLFPRPEVCTGLLCQWRVDRYEERSFSYYSKLQNF